MKNNFWFKLGYICSNSVHYDFLPHRKNEKLSKAETEISSLLYEQIILSPNDKKH